MNPPPTEVFLLVNACVVRNDLADHRVRVGKWSPFRVVNDVGKRDAQDPVAQLYRIGLVWVGQYGIKKCRVDCVRLFPNQTRECSPLGMMASPCRAQAAEQVHPQASRTRQLGGGSALQRW